MKTKNNFLLFTLTLLAGVVGVPISAQTNWTKDAANPVLRRDTSIANLSNDLIAISDCWVIKEGPIYKMWYTAGGLNYPPDTLLRSRICYATSVDGVNWSKYAGNPVMDVSYTGGWDSLGVETISILVDSTAPLGERYKMWYAGQYFNSYRYDIGYAYSPDGISWTKHPNPVMAVGTASEWDNGFLEGPSVIKDGSIYKMWYCGYDATPDASGTDGKANVGYATSPDGINWIKYAGNPVIVTGTNTWDSIYVQDPHVIKENGEYHMWYGGGSNGTYYDQQVGYATSLDGITWVKSPLNPVLTRGNTGDWDEILSSFPSVLNDGGTYKMWYTGRDVDPLPVGSLDYYWEIGYATAPFTGIENATSPDSGSISVFPNPAQYMLNIVTPFDPVDCEIYVYNLMGQVEMVGSTVVNNVVVLEVGDLANGVYFMEMKNGDQLCKKKFIVNN